MDFSKLINFLPIGQADKLPGFLPISNIGKISKALPINNIDKISGLLPLLGQLSPKMFGEDTIGGGLMSLLPLAQQFKQKESAPINFLQARQDIGFNAPRGGLLNPSLFGQTPGRY